MSLPVGFGVAREGFVPERNEGATIESSRKASSMLTPFFKRAFVQKQRSKLTMMLGTSSKLICYFEFNCLFPVL